MDFLNIFYEIIVQIFGTQYFTANLYFEKIAGLSVRLHKSLDEAIKLLHGMALR